MYIRFSPNNYSVENFTIFNKKNLTFDQNEWSLLLGKMLEILKEFVDRKPKVFKIIVRIPFADKDNVKGKLRKLEYKLKINNIHINQIKNALLDQDKFSVDVASALVITTKLKRTEVEDILEPEFSIDKFIEVEDKDAV